MFRRNATGRVARAARLLPVAVLTAGLLAAPAAQPAAAQPAAAQPGACGPPVPSRTQPGYTIADPRCDFGSGKRFGPLTDAAGRPITRTYTGIHSGAAYRLEVPRAWNGELVIYAHGYRGDGRTVWVDDPALRAHYVERGFAWAASSNQTNGYDVGQGVRDSHALIAVFGAVVRRKARSVYLTGASMGGHVTAVAVEHFRGSFVGAMPYCGVLGDAELFDYFLDANATAAALTGTRLSFPLQPPAEFIDAYRAQVAAQLPQLGTGFGRPGTPPTLTAVGAQWAAAVERRSGGDRPGFDAAFGFWSSLPSLPPLNDVPFLFGLYPGLDGGTAGIAPGNITGNRLTVYQLDDRWWLTRAELRLNHDVLRVTPTARPSRDLTGVPRVDGTPGIPVLSLHTIGDLFVPLSMEQVYAARAAAHGQSRLFVTRAIRGLQHCGFTRAELERGFDDLVSWVRTGNRPPGDDVLDRRAVAAAEFGCRFTVGTRPEFGPACRAG